MNTSETLNELPQALASFQSTLTTLPKDATGYGYKYMPIDTVVEAIRESLAQCGLSFVQMPTRADAQYMPAVALTTRLMHNSGEWLEDTLVIPVPQVGKANVTQNYGAALHYARRYALTSMLGIVADEDVDAAPHPPKKQQKESAPSFDDIPSASKRNGNGVTANQMKPSEKQVKAFFAIGKELYGPDWDDKRPALVKSVTNGRSDSAQHLSREEISKLIDGMKGKLEAGS